MTFTRRHCLTAIASGLALPVTGFAQDKWPSKPIRMMLGFPPGGGADAMARLMAKKLEDQLNNSVIVENKNGATGTICSQYVAKSAPDGYTLQLAHISSNVIAPLLIAKGKIDPANDFTPIGLLGISPHVLAINAKLPFKTVPELIAHAKANPGKLTFMSAGNGSAPHLAGESFKLQAGIDLLHVPFKGTGEALTALLAGEVDMTFSTTGSVMQHIKSGKLRAVGVCSQKKLSKLPNVAPIADVIPGYEVHTWYGVAGPANMPTAIVQKIEAAIQVILKQPDVVQRLDELDAEVRPGTAADFKKYWLSEVNKYQQIISKSKIQIS
jgi:tripartite-type tricarboxylate transporter receptor subunit TctC